MHEEMASLFNELAQLQLDKGHLETQIRDMQASLASIKVREDELRHKVGLAPIATRTRKTKDPETVADIRRAIRGVAALLTPSFHDYLPKSVLAKVISQKLPDLDVEDIEAQIKELSKMPDSCVRHNNLRGQGSGYLLVAPPA